MLRLLRAGRVLLCVSAFLALAACGGAGPDAAGELEEAATVAESEPAQPQEPADPGRNAPAEARPDAPAIEAPAEDAPAEPAPAAPAGRGERPAWLGTRVLPLRADGLGEVQPTPPELDDRNLPPPAGGLPPPDGDAFAATVEPVPGEVAARSTWGPHCPVALDELRYVTVTFWGFDDRAHTGELLVHAGAADGLVEVFRRIYEARFPIEEMRVIRADELDVPPTGDGNITTAFVCRSTVESGSWSQHAYGLAVDINPFHNPYARGDVVIPELASSYVDRARHRPGMIQPGDAVTDAFSAIGWPWGGNWRSAKDWMHFSANGR